MRVVDDCADSPWFDIAGEGTVRSNDQLIPASFLDYAVRLCKYLFRKKEEARLPLNLLILLSAFSIVFGLLQGSCLGLPREILPGPLKGLDFLADPAKSPAACRLAEKLDIANPMDLKDKFIQWFCFLLAALHLSSARIF